MNKPILKVENISCHFGAIKAVQSVSFEIPEVQVRAIIGPNGAGKSTLVDLICNRTPPCEGKVVFKSEDITGMMPHKIVHKGLCKCFQISKIFTNLTVFENVQIARVSIERKTFNFIPVNKRYLKDDIMLALDMVGISDKADEIAGFLSYGDQRRLDIAIALAMDPQLLILDEPAAGVERAEANKLMQLILELGRKRHMTILFIEHDMDIVFNYADVISVMNNGVMLATGTPDEIRQNTFVQHAYLGGEE